MDQIAFKPDANVPLANLILFAALKFPMATFTVSAIYNVICAWYPSYRADPKRWSMRIMLEMMGMKTLRQITVYGRRTDMWCLNFPRARFPHYQTLLLQGDSPVEPAGPIVSTAGPLTASELMIMRNALTIEYRGNSSQAAPSNPPGAISATTAEASNQVATQPTPSTSANAAGASAPACVSIPVNDETFKRVEAALNCGGQLRVVQMGPEHRLFCAVPLQPGQIAPVLAVSTGPTFTIPRVTGGGYCTDEESDD